MGGLHRHASFGMSMSRLTLIIALGRSDEALYPSYCLKIEA